MKKPQLRSNTRLAVLLIIGAILLYVSVSYFVDKYGVKIDADSEDVKSQRTGIVISNLQLLPFLQESVVDDKYQVVVLKTKYGKIEFGMLRHQAPVTAAHFIELAKEKVLQGGGFYRAEPSFVLQGGLHTGTKSYSGSSLKLEYKVPNFQGTVSMARSADPNSATTEFAIQLKDNSRWLGPGGADAYGYGVFAIILDGWDVVLKIMSLPAQKSAGFTRLTDSVMFDDCWVEERTF